VRIRVDIYYEYFYHEAEAATSNWHFATKSKVLAASCIMVPEPVQRRNGKDVSKLGLVKDAIFFYFFFILFQVLSFYRAREV
jgi:hypothetical protein